MESFTEQVDKLIRMADARGVLHVATITGHANVSDFERAVTQTERARTRLLALIRQALED